MLNFTKPKKQTAYDDLWRSLSLAQMFSASSLSHFGFVLDNVHYSNNQALAIVKQGKNIASITVDGTINTHQDISILH